MNAAGGPPLLALDGAGRATLTLNRPQQLNRLHRDDLVALQAHLARLAQDATLRVLVITAQGRAFCAGFNLEELAQAEEVAQAEAVGQDAPLFEHLVDTLEALPVPTIARLNGSLYGGAVDLALACDFRVGVHGMELRMPAARLGLHPYPSSLLRCVSRLGLQVAKRLYLLAETLPAEELLRIGYLDALVDAAGLDAAVQAIAEPLQAGAPLALRGMKLSLNELARGEFNLKRLRLREARCAVSDDLREGLAAFAARRTPRFTGR